MYFGRLKLLIEHTLFYMLQLDIRNGFGALNMYCIGQILHENFTFQLFLPTYINNCLR